MRPERPSEVRSPSGGRCNLVYNSTHADPAATSTSGLRTLRSLVGLIAWLLVCFAASGIGVVAVNRTLDSWYLTLRKPSWNPPNGVFGPVWTTLYTMMAVSAWLIWRRRAAAPGVVRVALGWFGVQLALNALWSWVFFAWRLPGLAFAEILILWATIAATIFWAWRVSRVAAVLMLPYLAWVTFASCLNGTIWWLNS